MANAMATAVTRLAAPTPRHWSAPRRKASATFSKSKLKTSSIPSVQPSYAQCTGYKRNQKDTQQLVDRMTISDPTTQEEIIERQGNSGTSWESSSSSSSSMKTKFTAFRMPVLSHSYELCMERWWQVDKNLNILARLEALWLWAQLHQFWLGVKNVGALLFQVNSMFACHSLSRRFVWDFSGYKNREDINVIWCDSRVI